VNIGMHFYEGDINIPFDLELKSGALMLLWEISKVRSFSASSLTTEDTFLIKHILTGLYLSQDSSDS